MSHCHAAVIFRNKYPRPTHFGHRLPGIAVIPVTAGFIAQPAQLINGRTGLQEPARSITQHVLFVGQQHHHEYRP